MIVNEITGLIGNTPMLKLKMKNNKWHVFLKLEKFNPGQSMKDRMALNMIEEAERNGELRPDGTIVESSSGNTAIGLAIISAAKGYRFIAIVDHHASIEKIDMIKAYGGEIVIVENDKKDGEIAVVEREATAKKIAKEMPNAFYPNQADNVNNRNAYIDTLAKELIDDLGVVNELYGAIGTGGSVCGTAMGLKKLNKNATINAVEPDGSIIFGGEGKPYFQSGTGNPSDAEIPDIIDYDIIDNNFYATDKEAFNTCRYFAKKYGILIGGSAGGVLFKALEDINKKSSSGNAVVLLCDGGEKYLNNIFNNEWMTRNNLLDMTIEEKIKEWI
ncbi:MAG: cysteine synthase family protein [Candidatus Nomurabacteria bacterium]|jgi:cystathionine beta-synthase|nr:cysteine synthase family protein [Candidatus Nomurabacteria bacterium]